MSHIIGYNRVSSESQSLDLGREALIKAGVPENRIYEEKVSGKSKDNRPQLEQCSRHYGKVMNALWYALTA